jgi:hypothetical protein
MSSYVLHTMVQAVEYVNKSLTGDRECGGGQTIIERVQSHEVLKSLSNILTYTMQLCLKEQIKDYERFQAEIFFGNQPCHY